MVTFLSKLGSLIVRGLSVASGVWPLVSPLFGSKAAKANAVENTIVNDFTSIGQVVVSAEAMLGAGTGAAKLAAASPLVANIVKTSEMLSGHTIANEALFLEGCKDITSGAAKVLNSLSPDTAKTAS